MSTRPQSRQRGAALLVTMVALMALLSIGGIALLSTRMELASSGHDRFTQMATYAAESGANAAMLYLRAECASGSYYSSLVEPNNVNPQSPVEIYGNNKPSGDALNPLAPTMKTAYAVTILNDTADPGLATGEDLNGIIVIRSVGTGPNQSQVTLEIEVQNAACMVDGCDDDFAQRGMTSLNDSRAGCSKTVSFANAATLATN